MKKSLVLLAALFLVANVAFSQKKEKVKLSKMDKEFLEKQPDGIYAKIETSRGTIYAFLESKVVPMTVANFVGLAEGTQTNTAKPAGVPYYDGLIFHRIIPGFMIQGGCPKGNGMGEPGYKFADEFVPNSELGKNGYKRGVLAMANSGPNTNGSQFFIMHKDYALPYSYSIFGHVVSGIEVVDSIVNSPRNGSDRPDVDQKINHITILRKGKDAEAFVADINKIMEDKIKTDHMAMEKILKEKYGSAATTGSGLKHIIEKKGDGPGINPGDNVTFHCTGYLLDGTKFWSSYDGPGQPLSLPMGANPPKLIPGMEEGIVLLKQGGKAKLIIPPNLGYGAAGSPPVIPPNSWLVFDVEVLKVGN
ncbi:MAG TPA: peptidylprolyl isomerase [Bacteroidia bacterium]|jgi:peptidyl-prolyl cis-trans isomerase A (cyclophilin A)|nr:peptidylprolyl isomerase [Bacteroidia bacterium]